MKLALQLSALVALASSALAASQAPIQVVGNHFFYSSNSSQMYVYGVAYQQDSANTTDGESFVDPLADSDACARDAPVLQALQTNVIRVYALNTSQNHDDCMKTFSDAGILVLADLSEPGLSINRDSPSWNTQLFARYTEVVDMMQGYDNVFGFIAGNEVTNNSTNTDASPFVKAAIRDTKAYIKQKGYPSYPVGYSANDDSDTRVDEAQYFTCGDPDERADFYGINMYEWCGDSTFQESGYADRTKEFSDIPVPCFFSEYGCNLVQPRKFTEVEALYSDNMTDVWSGGIVYLYFEEVNNYGLVSIGSDDKATTLPNYNNLKTELGKVTPTTVKASAATATDSTLSCPASTGSSWKANTALPPTPNQQVCKCLDSGLQCTVDSSVSSDDYGDLFGFICGVIDCTAITANGTSGEYGSFSFCTPKEQLNYVLNAYYQQNFKSAGSDACDFSGSASLNTAPSTAGSCASVFSAVGSAGTAIIAPSVTGAVSGAASTVTPTAKATGKATDSATGSAASSASASSSSSKGAAATVAPAMPALATSLVLGGVALIAVLN